MELRDKLGGKRLRDFSIDEETCHLPSRPTGSRQTVTYRRTHEPDTTTPYTTQFLPVRYCVVGNSARRCGSLASVAASRCAA
jgi:hypothetical protein